MPANVTVRLGDLPGSDAVRAEVERIIQRGLSVVLPGDTYAALELLQRTEVEFTTVSNKLMALHEAGVATAKDYDAYDVLRHNLYTVEKNLATRARELITRYAGADAAARVPMPEMAPPITAATPRRGRSVQGLGEVFAIAVAVIAVIVVLGLTAYFVSDALSDTNARDVTLLAEQARALKETYSNRTSYVRTCTSDGGDRATCAEEAARLYPTPAEAGVRVPSQGEGWGWVPWAVGGVAVITLAIVAFRVYRNERGTLRGLSSSRMPVRAQALRARPANRPLTAPTKGRYNLEV